MAGDARPPATGVGAYEARGVAATYRTARALPSDTVRVWIDAIHEAIGDTHVRVALDVGAGTGRFTRVLAEATGARVVAIEPSMRMLEERETRELATVRSVCAPGEALPIRAGAADLVQLSMSYHHLRDLRTAHAEFRRVLRPGGVVLVRTPTHETLERFDWAPFFPESLAIDRQRIPTHARVIDAFAAAGFTCRAAPIVWQRIAANLAEYAARVRSRSFSSMQALPDDVWAQRLTVFAEHCRTAPDGPIDEPVTMFVFER